jgi:hypothetical protein
MLQRKALVHGYIVGQTLKREGKKNGDIPLEEVSFER